MGNLHGVWWLRASRVALALSLAAVAPGLGHLAVGRWLKGVVLLGLNLAAMIGAGQLLRSAVPNYAALSSGQTAALLSGEQVLVLTALTMVMIGCIVYSVRDVRRLLERDQNTAIPVGAPDRALAGALSDAAPGDRRLGPGVPVGGAVAKPR